MTRVTITDYASDGRETYTLRVEGIGADVVVHVSPDGDFEYWVGNRLDTGYGVLRTPDSDVLDAVEEDITQAIAEFGDTLLREYEARDIHKIIREAELAAVRALAALHTDDDKEN